MFVKLEGLVLSKQIMVLRVQSSGSQWRERGRVRWVDRLLGNVVGDCGWGRDDGMVEYDKCGKSEKGFFVWKRDVGGVGWVDMGLDGWVSGIFCGREEMRVLVWFGDFIQDRWGGGGGG